MNPRFALRTPIARIFLGTEPAGGLPSPALAFATLTDARREIQRLHETAEARAMEIAKALPEVSAQLESARNVELQGQIAALQQRLRDEQDANATTRERRRASDAAINGEISSLQQAREVIGNLRETIERRALELATQVPGQQLTEARGQVQALTEKVAELESALQASRELVIALQQQFTEEGKAGEMGRLRADLQTATAERDRGVVLLELMEGALQVKGVDTQKLPAHMPEPAAGSTAEDYERRLLATNDPAKRAAITQEFIAASAAGKITYGNHRN